MAVRKELAHAVAWHQQRFGRDAQVGDGDDAQLCAGAARDGGGAPHGLTAVLRVREGDADPPERKLWGAVLPRRDDYRAGSAVQEAGRRAAEQHTADGAALGRPEDEQAGAFLLTGLVEPTADRTGCPHALHDVMAARAELIADGAEDLLGFLSQRLPGKHRQLHGLPPMPHGQQGQGGARGNTERVTELDGLGGDLLGIERDDDARGDHGFTLGPDHSSRIR
jgi:hypothetical protein